MIKENELRVSNIVFEILARKSSNFPCCSFYNTLVIMDFLSIILFEIEIEKALICVLLLYFID